MGFLSLLSQLAHYVVFYSEKPVNSFDRSCLIFSIDVDVGSQKLGAKNGGKNDRNVHNYLPESVIGGIEEQVIPQLLQMFNELEIPATFALRGQLTEVENSIIDLLLSSQIKHDIGAHGYYHKDFTQLSVSEAENELEMILIGMKKFNIKPTSFVFPKNKIAYLSLLESYGYSCFRGHEGIMNDGMYVKKYGKLYDVHPSFYLGIDFNPTFLNKILKIAINKRLPLHLWFHPWNLGQNTEYANKKITHAFLPFLRYAQRRQRNGVLEFETMHSITEKMENSRNMPKTN
jgi:peptidoglycan/xylan/chitin deacetylase (PgdA/CDA1 family)